MSVAAIIANQFAHGKVQKRKSGNAWRFVNKLGAWGFTFFALKGVAWLLLPLIAMYFT